MSEPIDGDSENIARDVVMQRTEHAKLTRRQIGFLKRQGLVQGRTLELQAATLENLHKAQQSHRLHILRERLHVVVDLAVGAGTLMIVGLLGWGIVSAWNSQGVVVSAFEVPPALEQQGLSGAVIASGVLDQLRAMQQIATRTSPTKRDIQDAWSGDIKLEIPEARISIGELQRYLHLWLSNETRIGGNLVQRGAALELTVRGSGFPARTFTVKSNELSVLTTEAAEYIYSRSEPLDYGVYLKYRGRYPETVAHAQREAAQAKRADQVILLRLAADALNLQGQLAEALERYRAVIRLDPEDWVSYQNLMATQMAGGDEEGAYRTGRTLERLGHRYGWFGAKAPIASFEPMNLLLQDMPASLQASLEDQAANGSSGSAFIEATPADAETYARLHDDRQARLQLQSSIGADNDPWVLGQTLYVKGMMALNRSDTAQALIEYEALTAALAQTPELVSNIYSPHCWIALAEELGGHPEHADAALAKGGHLVDCYRFKGDITDHRGDWVQAQKDYAAAVALAPDLPAAYQSWGEALARHGDHRGAIAKYQEANAHGPNWCDPPTRWGEALAAQGDDKGAIKQYARAAKLTPGWAHLELVWGQSLDRLGKAVQAQKKFNAAQDRELDLSEADRAALKAALLRQDPSQTIR